MKIADDCKYLFEQVGAKRWLKRNRSPRPNAILPLTMEAFPEKNAKNYLYSTDPKALKLTEWLMEKCNAEFKEDVLPSGFAGPSGVPGNFNALLNVSGYGMDPLPIPIANNAKLIEANGLADRARPSDVPWIKEIIRLFFGHVAPAPLHIRKAASTGFPYFTTDIQYKKLGTIKSLHNIDDWLNCMSGDASALKRGLNEYDSLHLYAIQERQQPNAIIHKDGKYSSKPRTAPTEEEARTGSYAGGTNADMTVRDVNGNLIENHFAMRRRDVFGANGIINYTLTAIFGCFRAVYLTRFAFTYKTRDRFDKQRKAASYKHVVGVDVKTMDKMVPYWFTMFVFDDLNNYLDERVVETCRRLFQAPYVMPSPWRDTAETFNPNFGGDPLKPENFRQHVGLPSGIAFNPDWGKLWMTVVYVILYRDVGAIFSIADIEPLLRGLNKNHAFLDMSDDAAFFTNSDVVAERLKSPKSPYAVLEVEQPVIFLGDVFCSVAGKVEVYPNPLTYLVNALCREDSIDGLRDGRSPTYRWAESVMARQQVYSSTPIFRDMNRLYEEGCKLHLGLNPNLIAKTLGGRTAYSEADALVRANPGVLHYKVDPADVTPEVLNDVVATIAPVNFYDRIKHLFKVPTIAYEEVE